MKEDQLISEIFDKMMEQFGKLFDEESARKHAHYYATVVNVLQDETNLTNEQIVSIVVKHRNKIEKFVQNLDIE